MKTKILLSFFLVLAQLSHAVENRKTIPVNPRLASTVNQTAFPFYNAHRLFNDANVNWVFSNPILVVFFHVERSTDGVNFETIAEVYPGNNMFYRYRDRTVVQGKTYYYRIAAYQHDGGIFQTRIDAVTIVRRCN
jgi:hypothetical protein